MSDDDTRERITLILLYDPAEGRDKEHTGYHYITVTSLPALLRGDARNDEAHCVRCLYTFAVWERLNDSKNTDQNAVTSMVEVSSG